MTDRDKIRGRVLARRVLSMLPPGGEARELFNAALSGTGSGYDAVAEAPREIRGLVAVALHYAGVPPAELRDALRLAWLSAYGYTVQAAHDQGNCLMAMFKRAAFPIPAELPETVTIYRGTSGIPARLAQKGHSWTSCRGAGCWRATHDASSLGGRSGEQPIVLRRDVPKSSIVFYEGLDTQSHDEFICDLPPGGEVDGDEAEWRATADSWAAGVLDWRTAA